MELGTDRSSARYRSDTISGANLGPMPLKLGLVRQPVRSFSLFFGLFSDVSDKQSALNSFFLHFVVALFFVALPFVEVFVLKQFMAEAFLLADDKVLLKSEGGLKSPYGHGRLLGGLYRSKQS